MSERTISPAEHNAILGDRESLVAALKKYADCRHGCEHCFCVAEARAALYPYLRRAQMLGDHKFVSPVSPPFLVWRGKPIDMLSVSERKEFIVTLASYGVTAEELEAERPR